jgi:hypothetical protein
VKPRLTDEELVLFQAWLWEHARGKEDGAAHRMAGENRVDLPLCLLVCGEPTEVVRNIPGMPRYSAFLCGMASDHDLFLCSRREEAWQRQALELMRMAETAPCRAFQQELEKEAQTVLATRKPTKDSWSPSGREGLQ